MSKTIEHKIRLNVILIYVIVALICAGGILYMYRFGHSVENRKRHVAQYHQTFALTNELIYSVNRAQAEAGMYVISSRPVHLQHFREYVEEVERVIDSLTAGGQAQDTMLQELGGLLAEKGKIVSELHRQFDSYNPLEPLNQRLQTLDTAVRVDSLLAVTVIKDTLITHPPKKGFWKRFAEVFSPTGADDTLVSVVTVKTDTVRAARPSQRQLLTEVSDYTEQAGRHYARRMRIIEQQVNQLMLADQEISRQISSLLMRLYRQNLDAAAAEVQGSEQLIQSNARLSIITGGVALALILVCIILIIGDVNRGYALRQKLEQAHARTRQIMDSRHRLLLAVSHDIKTPLSSILGYLELCRGGLSPSPREMASMQNSGKHILALLENVLKFSSLEQGTLQVAACRCDLHDICRETLDMFIPLAQQKGLAVHSDFPLKAGTLIWSDPLKIRQIITNLLSNAVKYTPAGQVSLGATLAEGQLTLSVTDTGVGIPANQMDSLFQPFTRIGKSSSMAEGSGFGMYVVKGLVDLLQGHIQVTSEEGRGTAIVVTLPVHLSVPAAPPAAAPTPKSILAVDDDAAFLALLDAMLGRLGHRVTACGSIGELTQCLAQGTACDMVITDLEMGAFSGKEVLDRVRQTGQPVPVAVVTGRGDFDEASAAAMGFDGYLPKPLTLASLALLLGEPAGQAYEPASLERLFDGDREAVLHVLDTFVAATREHLLALEQALAQHSFDAAQPLCHKMLPMFMQVNAPATVVALLKKMDAARRTGSYAGWEKDTTLIVEETRWLLGQIRETYFGGA